MYKQKGNNSARRPVSLFVPTQARKTNESPLPLSLSLPPLLPPSISFVSGINFENGWFFLYFQVKEAEKREEQGKTWENVEAIAEKGKGWSWRERKGRKKQREGEEERGGEQVRKLNSIISISGVYNFFYENVLLPEPSCS